MNNRVYSSLIGILVSLYIFHDVPIVTLFFPRILYAIVTIGSFVLLALGVNWKHGVRVLPFFILPFLSLLVDFSISSMISIVQLMIFPLAGLYVLQSNNKKLGSFLFLFFISLQLITSITTSIGLQNYPLASRIQAMGDATDNSEYYFYKSLNIGGFDFIYTLVVLFPILLLSWKCRIPIFKIKGNKPQRYIVPISIIALVTWTIVSSQYTTATIVIAICFLMLVISRKIQAWKMIIISVVFFTMFSLFKPMIGKGILFVSQQFESEVVQSRLDDVGMSLQGQQTSQNSDYDARMDMWEKSIATFLDYPFGTWSGGTGGHSFFLDSLALYGIMGVIALLILFQSVYSCLIKPLNNWKLYNCAIFVFFAFFVTALLNPHIYYNVLLFILPLFFYIYYDVRLIL